MRPNHLPCIIVLSLFVVALLAGDVAAQVYVDVVINGHRLYHGGLVHQDRTYVRLDDVATVLGGEMIYDPEIKVAFVNTGRYRQLRWRTLVQLNPELQAYQPMSPMAAGEGVHYGIPGPHLTVLVSPAGVVTGFQLAAPQEQTERLPWFDQEEPVALPGVGRGYTHTLYVVQPELIELGGATEIAFNGLPVRLAGSAILWYENQLYVRLRDLAVASGGGVGWDPDLRVASAKVVPGADLSYDKLAFLNSDVRQYFGSLSSFVPEKGYPFGPDGTAVLLLLSDRDRSSETLVHAFEAILPTRTQTIYVVAPESIEPAPEASDRAR